MHHSVIALAAITLLGLSTLIAIRNGDTAMTALGAAATGLFIGAEAILYLVGTKR